MQLINSPSKHLIPYKNIEVYEMEIEKNNDPVESEIYQQLSP